MSATALLNTAYDHHRAGRRAKAAELYRDILRREPANFDALYLLGVLHFEEERFAEAHQLLAQALVLRPDFADGWNKRAIAALHSGRIEDAVASFERASALLPENPQLLSNLGNALAQAGRFEAAIESYSRALMLAPGDLGILNHRGITAFEAKRYAHAVRDFDAILARDPEFPYARGNRLYARAYLCDWRNIDAEKKGIALRLERGARVITPIQHAALFESASAQLEAGRIWCTDICPPAAQVLWRDERYHHSRVRIAYLSADFHAHATAALIAGVFEQHDRTRFDVHAISYGPDDGSPMRQRLKNAAGHFHDVRSETDSAIAQILRRLEIDIAVDLKGHTQEARPGILAHRPAPVQAQYLGFPGTLGAAFIDYVIADRTVIPEADAPQYSEKVAVLPHSYQANDDKREIGANAPPREALGLPSNGFVFCCFNNSYKIMPDIFAIWMRLLTAIKGSVLWLLDDNPDAVRNLCAAAEASGISASRLVFAPRIDLPSHLARHTRADLFLDTLPYGAHTTASDALWAGLPVATCVGESFAGRVGASLLRALDMRELIAPTRDAYEALALRLAQHPAKLAAIKEKLTRARTTAPLFDTARFTRALEAAYVAMWQRSQRGEAPEAIAVPESA